MDERFDRFERRFDERFDRIESLLPAKRKQRKPPKR
jgi:hypothetical protein